MTAGQPTRVVDRIETLDLLRGVAICGILLMNIPLMGMTGSLLRPADPATWSADWIAWGIQHVLFDGTMRGLFTLLFGAGMLLMLKRADEPSGGVASIDAWTRRCLLLMALGVVQFAVLLWPWEILFNYGLVGLILLAFRRATVPQLLAAALFLIAILIAWDAVSAHEEGVRALTTAPEPAAMVDPEERAQRLGWPSMILWSWEYWSGNHFGDWSWYGVAETLASMLIGMALFRTGVLTGRASTRSYVLLLVLGYGLGIGARLAMPWMAGRIGYDDMPGGDPIWSQMVRLALSEPARLAITVGHVGALVLLFRSGLLGRAGWARALGRTALTTYMLQSLLTSVLFYGFGLLDAFGFAGLMGVAAAIWVITGAFSLWWLARHEQGPVEALLRAAVYGSLRRRELPTPPL